MKPIIVWPDGSEQPAPENAYLFSAMAPDFFVWDEKKCGWIDSNGNLCHFENQYFPGIGRITIKKNQLSQSHSCECGAHAVKSSRHSPWCKLYKEFV